MAARVRPQSTGRAVGVRGTPRVVGTPRPVSRPASVPHIPSPCHGPASSLPMAGARRTRSLKSSDVLLAQARKPSVPSRAALDEDGGDSTSATAHRILATLGKIPSPLPVRKAHYLFPLQVWRSSQFYLQNDRMSDARTLQKVLGKRHLDTPSATRVTTARKPPPTKVHAAFYRLV